jgi:hypothetical protein
MGPLWLSSLRKTSPYGATALWEASPPWSPVVERSVPCAAALPHPAEYRPAAVAPRAAMSREESADVP